MFTGNQNEKGYTSLNVAFILLSCIMMLDPSVKFK